MRFQRTLDRETSISGVGLHSGQSATLTLYPAPPNTGLVFRRPTANGDISCPADIDHLHPSDLCTALRLGDLHAQTIEHVLAALAGLEIDNAFLRLEGHEVPAVDGSAAPFADAMYQAGVRTQDTLRTYVKITDPITVGDEERYLSVVPSPLPRISYTIDYAHPLIQEQTYEYTASPTTFHRQIAPARTFGFRADVERLWANGLGLGGTLENTIVFSDDGILNDSGFRFTDECVRHKVLDLIGDLALLGMPVIGRFVAYRAGHHLHADMVHAIRNHPDRWIPLHISEDDTNRQDTLGSATRSTSHITA